MLGGAVVLLMCGATANAEDVSSAFVYHGSLIDDGTAVTGDCDLVFTLWDAASGPGDTQIGLTLVFDSSTTPIALDGGTFTVSLDFGPGAFNGEARWLQIDVCCLSPCSPGYTMLDPRQQLKAAPHAVRAVEGVGPPNAINVDAATGKVGIGTGAPSKELDVVGDVQASGTIASGGSVSLDGTTHTISSNADLEMHVSSGRALRIEPDLNSPNLIGGYSGNSVLPGTVGATVAGGGQSTNTNQVTDDYGTISGGYGNQAGDNAGTTSDKMHATVGGGRQNKASHWYTTVGGGQVNNASGPYATVGGGYGNTASNSNTTVAGGSTNTASSSASTIGGGEINSAVGYGVVVAGGWQNTAGGSLASIGGGHANSTGGSRATVPGGQSNTANGDYSFAAGRRAKANNQGAFVWGDSTDADFTSTGLDQFLIRAGGGVGIGTNTPAEQLDVAGNIHASGTIASGNSITIDGTPGSENIASSAALELHTSDGRTLRLEPAATGTLVSPNLIGGSDLNSVTVGVIGATIAGGGRNDSADIYDSPNRVTDDFGAIGGGLGNQAGDDDEITTNAYFAVVGGGQSNTASGSRATAGGGSSNTASGSWATVGGGWNNEASDSVAARSLSSAEHVAARLIGITGLTTARVLCGNYVTVEPRRREFLKLRRRQKRCDLRVRSAGG